MSKKFDNDPVTYTHFGLFGLIPVYWSEDGDGGANIRPVWGWLRGLIEPQAHVMRIIGNLIHFFNRRHEPGFAIFLPRRLPQPEGAKP